MSQSFTLAETPHLVFGALATLAFPGQPVRRFTREEAAIVARALEALAQKRSLEQQIYMTPIASDHDFEALVGAAGIIVASAGCAEVALDCDETRALAKALASFGAASAAVS